MMTLGHNNIWNILLGRIFGPKKGKWEKYKIAVYNSLPNRIRTVMSMAVTFNG